VIHIPHDSAVWYEISLYGREKTKFVEIPRVKSCPFCGSEDIAVVTDRDTHDYPIASWWAKCLDCEARGPETTESEQKAYELWNDIRI
jgi:Lar family restriction alleviation protein